MTEHLNDTEQHEAKVARIKWACRRGMLELDLFFKQFLETDFQKMTNQELDDFLIFLENPDPDLYAWLMGYQKPERVLDVEMTRRVQASIPDLDSNH